MVSVDRIKYIFYASMTAFITTSYLLIGVGVYIINPEYLHWMATIFHILISVFLMYRFNPITKAQLRPHDENIIFGSAVLMLVNVVFSVIGNKHENSPLLRSPDTVDVMKASLVRNTAFLKA